jgi:hypothetical protein
MYRLQERAPQAGVRTDPFKKWCFYGCAAAVLGFPPMAGRRGAGAKVLPLHSPVLARDRAAELLLPLKSERCLLFYDF